jgi:hypothetical protein
MNKIITISRECGSFGHTIAQKLSEELGIPCYDKDIIALVAEKCQLSNDYVSNSGELLKEGFLNSVVGYNDHIYPYSTPSLQNQINSVQVEIIEELAKKGSCIIVGRGADYILRHNEHVLNVFIKADMDSKIKHSCEEHNLSPKEAKNILTKRDKERSKHYYFYTGRTWGDAKNYHMVLDSGKLGVDMCVKLISEAYNNL